MNKKLNGRTVSQSLATLSPPRAFVSSDQGVCTVCSRCFFRLYLFETVFQGKEGIESSLLIGSLLYRETIPSFARVKKRSKVGHFWRKSAGQKISGYYATFYNTSAHFTL